MTDNPYSTSAIEATPVPRRLLACSFMFWLAAMLGLVTFGITVLSVYNYAALATQNNGRLPSYVIAATVLDAVCTLLLFCSAKMWRASNARLGIAFLVAGVISFFGAPLLLNSLAG